MVEPRGWPRVLLPQLLAGYISTKGRVMAATIDNPHSRRDSDA